MTTPRRDFLGWLGAGGVLAAGGIPRVAAALPVPVSDKWDVSWCERVNGKVRAVFDSPGVAEGAALFRAQVWRDEHKEVYGTPRRGGERGDRLSSRGDPARDERRLLEAVRRRQGTKIKDEKTKKWTTVNPIASAPPGTPAKFANYNLPAFIGSGGIVLACNFAFGEMVQRFIDADKLSKDDARKRAMEHLIPGIILQPSGVFAALRAQQAGCNYLLAG